MDIRYRRLALGLLLLTGATSAQAQSFFTTQASFNTAVSALSLMGTENWSSGSAGGLISVNDSVAPGVANGPFPTGTSVLSGITVQSNTLANPATPSPRGVGGLAFGPTGTVGTSGNVQPSNQLSANNFGDSFDILFANAGGKSARGVDLSTMFYQINGATSGALTIRAYSPTNTLLGTTTVSGVVDVSEAAYIGFVVGPGQTLGRINVAVNTPTTDVPGADNIRVFGAIIPEPGTFALALLALPAALSVRRSSRGRQDAIPARSPSCRV